MLSDPSFLVSYEELEMVYEVLSDEKSRHDYNVQNSLPLPPSRRSVSAPAEDIWEQTYVFLLIATLSAALVIGAIAAITGEMPDWINH
jgi:hypothetical protein